MRLKIERNFSSGSSQQDRNCGQNSIYLHDIGKYFIISIDT